MGRDRGEQEVAEGAEARANKIGVKEGERSLTTANDLGEPGLGLAELPALCCQFGIYGR